jgi:hypothetical protein
VKRRLTAIELILCAALAVGGMPMASADGTTLDVDLPGLPPPVQRPIPSRDTVPALRPPRAPTAPTARASEKYRRLADRVGQLAIVQGRLAVITRAPQPYLQPLVQVPEGTYLVVKGQQGDWRAVLMIDGSIGWIPAACVRLLQADVVRRGTQETSPWAPPSGPGLGSAILREAFRYLGVRYVWGGNGYRGIDCSGLVKSCFARLGLGLPRTASQQARVGYAVPFSDRSQLQPGDRLYFAVKGTRIDHTGIYIGNDYFIHSSMSRGEVGVDRLSRPLYERNLVAVRRT